MVKCALSKYFQQKWHYLWQCNSVPISNIYCKISSPFKFVYLSNSSTSLKCSTCYYNFFVECIRDCIWYLRMLVLHLNSCQVRIIWMAIVTVQASFWRQMIIPQQKITCFQYAIHKSSCCYVLSKFSPFIKVKSLATGKTDKDHNRERERLG